MRRAIVAAGIAVVLCAFPGCAEKNSARYFGQIPQPGDVALTPALSQLEQNPCRLGERCGPAEAVFKAIYKELYYPEWPKLLVHLKGDGSVVQPLLMWKGVNTAYLHGAKNLFVLVIAESRQRLEARVTTLTPKWINPFVGLVSAFGSAAEKKESEVDVSPPLRINLYPIKAADDRTYWYGATGFTLQTDTISRVSIRPVREEVTVTRETIDTRPAATQTATQTTKRTKTEKESDQVTVTTETATTRPVDEANKSADSTSSPKVTTTERRTLTSPEIVPVTLVEDQPQLKAESVQANLSNTDGSWAGVAIGAGGLYKAISQTVKIKNEMGTEVGRTATTHHLGAFLYGKLYVVRPLLRVRGQESGVSRFLGKFFGPYRPSLALIIGTNLSPSSSFNDLMVGVSLGHLVGRLGIVGGVEFAGARTDFSDKTQHGGFVGFDYSF